MSELNNIALKILSNGRGILAADESTGTMTKRLEAVNVESTPENRLLFRETLFTSECIKNCIGGVILYDETFNQTTSAKNSIPELISNSTAIPGIKVDSGAEELPGSTKEFQTKGLEGLEDRLAEYYKHGARFAKWRGVYVISDEFPSLLALNTNSYYLARYSFLVQEAGMVPIVEPEVLMNGNHSAEECYNKTSIVLKKCFENLNLNKVDLTGIILKPNMILPGSNSNEKITNDEIAKLTLKCIEECVPKEVPGIAFLSGGQSEVEATQNLNLINKYNKTNFIMSFSYGRALQQSALKFWSKNTQDTKGTQNVFNHRANMCSLAAQGKWSVELEKK